ncbi:hypothetical protein L218DRAFT_1081630 [Marasmius fiardii PR-910]|nr:hypothetical protein L218DRAFT_1081630 [Marasmius fiardii PR-910]
MFGLIRRISGSIIPRPDRPWEEDATSNAPQVGRKRRRSSAGVGDEDPYAETELSKKRVRGDTPLTQDGTPSSTPQPADSEGLKEVTKGVKEVELEDKEKTKGEEKTAEDIHPETVPLPEEVAGELDSSSIASTPPPPGLEDEGGEEGKDIVTTTGTEGEAGIKEGHNQSDDDETKVDDVPEATNRAVASKEPSKEPVTEVSTDGTAAQQTVDLKD